MPAERGEAPRASHRAGRWLLAVGAGVGLTLAASQLLVPSARPARQLAPGAVASVNGVPIRREEFERAVAALGADRRNPVGEAERRRVLERLIDEELLVQRGLELGLTRHDRRLRAELIAAVLQSVVSEGTTREPSSQELEAFFRDNADYFARPGRLHVRQILVRIDTERAPEAALERARLAATRLADGEPFGSVAAELGDPALPELPDAPLTPGKLREYLGPTAARTALALEPGAVSEPVRSAAGFRVLQLLQREQASAPGLPEIEDQVRIELRRRAGDQALRAYLEQLREQAEVHVSEMRP